MNCIYCNSSHVHKDGNHNGLQRYRCLDCNKKFDGEAYDTKYIEHFGIKIKDKSTNKLTRDNYCIPTNKTDSETRKSIEMAELYKMNNINVSFPKYFSNLPNEVFIDKDTYTDDWVKKHYDNCMYNYDLNMKYFDSLGKEEFNKELDDFIKRNKLNQIKSNLNS